MDFRGLGDAESTVLDSLAIRNAGLRRQLESVPMNRLNLCKLCGGLPHIDKFKPPASDYLVECSSKDCDNAEFGDTPEEAIRLWNFANPDWDGNVPVR